ncbi:hypothetical protein QA612_17550 [Evansella sp. AB-P1]|uniref:hypothetical protein n=1 Tax=Evansella sp. AB-P1 TaxID=3037653 RepID=UPI00241C8D40|nr:hypothetical protein [Evansella sp. AB-P1]MDG5789268.1 hypothetical protein [Evansella sp. AB-P1]
MTKTSGRIGNPLTVIGLFAGLAEVAMLSALAIVDESLQPIFILFVIGFPILLVVLFFLTLNFNPKVLYAPSDYEDERLFVKTLNRIKVDPYANEKQGADEEKIESFHNQTFTNKVINIDNKEFRSCHFDKCTLVYKGEGYFHMEDCSFHHVSWNFEKNAAQVINFLSTMYMEYGDTGKEIVEVTFSNIKNGLYHSIAKSERGKK